MKDGKVGERAAACHGRFFPFHLTSLDLDRITTRPSVAGPSFIGALKIDV